MRGDQRGDISNQAISCDIADARDSIQFNSIKGKESIR
jgi:hypothetical protein